jgi:hypothetical protein
VPSISRQLLSGSTNGRMIQVTGTATGSANTIHTAVSGTTNIDEVYLWATNTSVSDVLLTIEFGGTGTANEVDFVIPGQVGLVEVVNKLILNNSLLVKAFAATGSVINIGGYVNRIVP